MSSEGTPKPWSDIEENEPNNEFKIMGRSIKPKKERILSAHRQKSAKKEKKLATPVKLSKDYGVNGV